MSQKSKISVLIIEDSQDDADLIRLEIKRAGFAAEIDRVDSVIGLREALARKSYDVITSDYNIPGFSFKEALQIWNDSPGWTPFIVVSGVLSADEAVSFMKAGASDFILKDNLSKLGPVIERELRKVKEQREKEKIREELRSSQERYRVITENMTDAVWIMDVTTQKMSYMNRAATANFGYTLDEINRRTVDQFMTPESLNLFRLQMQNFYLKGEILWDQLEMRSFQVEYIRKDGSHFWSEDVLSNLKDDQGNITHILGVGRDITLRKKQEEEVLRSRDYVWTLFENFPALIWRAGVDAKCNYFNKSWLNWTGRTLEQEYGDGWAEGVYLDDLERCLKVYKTAFNAREPFQMDYRLRHASGEYHWITDIASPYYDLEGNFAGYVGSCYDIQENRTNQELIGKRAEKMAQLSEITAALNKHQSMDSLLDLLCRKTMEFLEVPQCGLSIYDPLKDVLVVKKVKGYDGIQIGFEIPRGQGIAGTVMDTLEPIILADYSSNDSRLPAYRDAPFAASMSFPMVYGEDLVGVIGVSELKPSRRVFREDDISWASLLFNAAASAIHNANLYDTVQTSADQLAMLYDAGLALNSILEPKKQLTFLMEIAHQALNCQMTCFIRYLPDERSMVFETFHTTSDDDVFEFIGKSYPINDSPSIFKTLLEEKIPIYIQSELLPPDIKPIFSKYQSCLFSPVMHGKNFIGIISACDPAAFKFSPADERMLVLFGNQTAVAMENARMFKNIQDRSSELESLARISASLRSLEKFDELMPNILSNLIKLTHSSLALYVTPGEGQDVLMVVNSAGGTLVPGGTPVNPQMARLMKANQGKVFPVPLNVAENCVSLKGTHGPIRFGISVPLIIENTENGNIFLGIDKPFENNIPSLLSAVANMAANAMFRAKTHEETQRRVEYLSALHTIDNAITSSTDIFFTLNILTDQIKEKLHVDGVVILLADTTTNYLEYAASAGFTNNQIKKTKIRIGESFAGRAAIERKMFRVQGEADTILQSSPFLKGEGFMEFIGHPLIIKGKLLGVLEIFNRQLLNADDAWMEFVESISQQAAIAIDNARLFEELEKSNFSLLSAYDTTLEGWSSALDLRDHETHGHSKRVVDLTMEIALQLGMEKDKLIHIRRGALLHDIGKMGVPDYILLKPDALTPEERTLMEQHPIHAYNLLIPIHYLKQAIDIPYTHHEKWDGTGYPRGLKGNMIPLAGRIFAVVDVFDALTSDRPYRKAWPEQKAIDYIKEQSGKHFDPEVVEVFLRMIQKEDRE